jgi:hypothetical protein
MENLTYSMIDFLKTQILSRGMTVDQQWMDSFRIKHIFNKVENVDYSYMQEAGLEKAVAGIMDKVGEEVVEKMDRKRGSCMLVESGLKESAGGHVVVTTIFHFCDIYSMNLFVLKYPHKTWNHMKEMFEFMN